MVFQQHYNMAITANDARKIAVSAASEDERKDLAATMCHSVKTAMKRYKVPDVEEEFKRMKRVAVKKEDV